MGLFRNSGLQTPVDRISLFYRPRHHVTEGRATTKATQNVYARRAAYADRGEYLKLVLGTKASSALFVVRAGAPEPAALQWGLAHKTSA